MQVTIPNEAIAKWLHDNPSHALDVFARLAGLASYTGAFKYDLADEHSGKAEQYRVAPFLREVSDHLVSTIGGAS